MVGKFPDNGSDSFLQTEILKANINAHTEEIEAFKIWRNQQTAATNKLNADLATVQDASYKTLTVMRRELTNMVEIMRKFSESVKGLIETNLAQMERMKFLEARIEGMEKHLAANGKDDLK